MLIRALDRPNPRGVNLEGPASRAKVASLAMTARRCFAREDADSFGCKAADGTQSYLQDAKAMRVRGPKPERNMPAGIKFDSMRDQAADLKQRGCNSLLASQ
jgi:hypothetical protein